MNAELIVSDRIGRLRTELFAAEASVCFERARIVTDSFRATAGEHNAVRRGKALAAVFSEMPIFIREGELIVGQRAARLGARATYPEYDLDGLSRESTPPEVWDYWHGRTLGDDVHRAHPERLRLAESEMAAGWCTGTSTGYGHVIVDYEKALNQGFRAIIREAEGLLPNTAPDDIEGRAFLESVVIAAEGIIRWANRYADLAETEADRPGGSGILRRPDRTRGRLQRVLHAAWPRRSGGDNIAQRP